MKDQITTRKPSEGGAQEPAEIHASTEAHAATRVTAIYPELCPVECYAEDAARAGGVYGSGEPGNTSKSGWRPPTVHSYGVDFDPTKIPCRRWLLGHRRAMGEVTVDVGPPGVNKSTLLLTDAVSIVTGRQLLADKPYLKGEVLLFAGEDARRDVEARLAGILTHHRISPGELAGRLHVVYLAEVNPLAYSLAQMSNSTAVVNRQLLEWIKAYPGLVAAFIDPIAAWHMILENDTSAMKVLCTELRRTAVTAGIHVGIDHHITKATMSDPEGHVENMAAARGAYIAADARWAFTLAKLRQRTAEEFGIPEQERSRWRRLDSLKASYGADDADMRLLHVASVTIANGESVAVLCESDVGQIRADVTERQATKKVEHNRAVIAALTSMLEKSAPRSAEGAAAWLQTHHPELFPGRGGPLSTKSIRERLPTLIGRGLNTMRAGRPDRIVCGTSGVGRGARWEITFAQMELV